MCGNVGLGFRNIEFNKTPRTYTQNEVAGWLAGWLAACWLAGMFENVFENGCVFYTNGCVF